MNMMPSAVSHQPLAIRYWLFAILLFGFAFRIHDLGAQSLWLDEAYTYDMVVKHDWLGVWSAMLYWSNVSPLSYIPLKLSLLFLGTSEFALRFSSAMWGWLAIGAVYRLSRSITQEATSLLTTALVAFSPFTVWYARDARAYGMYLLFSALTLWAFLRAERGRGWIAYIIHSALWYITHYLSALYTFAMIAYTLTRMRNQPLLFRRLLLAQLPAAVPVIIWIAVFISTRQGIAGMAWIPQVTLLTPLQTLWNFFSGDATDWTPLMIIGIILIVALMITGARSTSSVTPLLLWYLILPIVTAWLFSLRKPSYVDRYFEPTILPVMLLTAMGLMKLPRAWGRYVIALIIIGMLFSSSRIYFDPEFAKEDWRGAAKKIESLQLPVSVPDPESPLALSPYISPIYMLARDGNELSDLASKTPFIFVLRSPYDSNHTFSKSESFDPLKDGSPFFKQWVKDNPSIPIRIYKFTGLALIVIGK